ncbi:MFS transporter [Nonomuraea sp. NPDC050783]|uniref:MFS transporter n=1 Tax=Nonomuraea sp. NPDC050783 TaxID=3154634 RepID=UPI0034662E26
MLGAATFTQAAAGFFVQGIGAMGVQLRQELGVSAAQLGLLLSAAQLVPLVGLLVAGELLDRYDERWVVGAGALVVAASLGVGSQAPGYPALLLVLLVVGAGYSTIQPGGSKSVASWFGASQRGLAMGVRQAGLPLGGVLAAAALPALAEVAGWRATLAAGALVAFLGAVAFMSFCRRPPLPPPGASGSRPTARTPHGNQPTARAPHGNQPAARRLHGRAEVVRGRWGLLREPVMVKILVSGMVLVSVHSGIGVLTVLHLHGAASVGAGAAALVFMAVQGAGAAGRVCLAAWSDRSRFGRYACVLACLAAVTAGAVALMTPAGRSPVVACLLFLWLGFFGIGWYGPWVAYLAESAPPGRTGFALGSAMAVNQVAIVLAPPALGLVTDLTGGFATAWGLLGLMAATALVLTARRPARPPFRDMS